MAVGKPLPKWLQREAPVSRDCTVDGCVRQIHARGWCRFHYGRWEAYGQVEDFDPIPLDPNVGVDDVTVETFKQVAGDGDLDERCRRILAVNGGRWFGGS